LYEAGARGADDRGRGDPRSGGGKGRPGATGNKRTSRNSDERSPTRSGIQYPTRRYRQRDAEVAAPAEKRPSLRKVRRGGAQAAPVEKERRARKASPTRRRPLRSTEATEELRQLAGRGAGRAVQQLARAAEAVNAGHERDAARLLRPLRDAYPDAAAVRELLGLVHYRLGQYPAASRELGTFADLTGSVEQHPVLMDCARAQKKWARVAALWEELAAASPSAALVSEGRIVMAGSLADRGRLRDAVAILERRGGNVQRPAEHHLRVWYALADLCERTGDLPRARELFDRVRRRDAAFADVAERLLALG
jgi:tetratricopeptide (TPR) repeat protein